MHFFLSLVQVLYLTNIMDMQINPIMFYDVIYLSNPITNVGTEPLASQCLQDDEPTNDTHAIETGRDRNSDRASLLQAGGSCPTFKCLTNCEEEPPTIPIKMVEVVVVVETTACCISLTIGHNTCCTYVEVN